MACVVFPKPMKRALKVKHGPVAEILAFPQALAGDTLHARWAWLFYNAVDWAQVNSDGTFSERRDWEAAVRITGRMTAEMHGEEFNDAYMRRDVQRLAARIQQRAKLKRWLRDMGLSDRQCLTPETALMAVYERMSAEQPPLQVG